MQAAELRQKSATELKSLLAELQEKLRSLRFERAANRLKNTRETSGMKRDVARIMTILNEGKEVKKR